jgi:spore coat protein CotH
MRARLAAVAFVAALAAAPVHASDRVFDPRVLHETRIVMDPADWKALQDNFLTDQYYAANLSIDGEVVLQIGVRSRGKGSRDATKPGLKLDMNRYVKGQRFHGLKSIAAKNLLQDPSMLREHLCMLAFQAMGIQAPATSFTRLTVNDQYWGVYELGEAVEQPFLTDRFGENDGYLYKYEYSFAYDFRDRGTNPSAYVPDPFKPETHEDHPDPSGLIALVQAVNGGADSTFSTDISAYLDPRAFLTYLAVENAVAEDDGFLGYAGMNNFYVYQYVGRPRFVLIPWDKDTSLNNPAWPLFQRSDADILSRRLFADPAMRQFYVDEVRRAVTQFVNPSWLGAHLEQAYALIRNAALEDQKKPFTNDQFELAVGGLRSVIEARGPDALAQISALGR